MIQSPRVLDSVKDKKALNRLFIGAMLFLELIVLTILFVIIIKVIGLLIGSEAKLENGHLARDFYNMLALGLIFLWFGILIGYYAWAIYFFNINLGITNLEWEEVRDRYGYIPENTDDVRNENPNSEQTLGLPPGTVRGTIALTLLVGGLAMSIASLGMDTTLKANSFLVDNFDFFKTAFLMMVAFYFGNKALEAIGYKSSRIYGTNNKPEGQNVPSNGGTSDRSTVQVMNGPASTATGSATELKNILKGGDASPLSFDPNIEPAGNDQDFNNPKAVQ